VAAAHSGFKHNHLLQPFDDSKEETNALKNFVDVGLSAYLMVGRGKREFDVFYKSHKSKYIDIYNVLTSFSCGS